MNEKLIIINDVSEQKRSNHSGVDRSSQALKWREAATKYKRCKCMLIWN